MIVNRTVTGVVEPLSPALSPLVPHGERESMGGGCAVDVGAPLLVGRGSWWGEAPDEPVPRVTYGFARLGVAERACTTSLGRGPSAG